MATQEYLTRHTLESFLDRLSTTGHAKGFVLKGGLLMGAYDARRPTKDVDSNAISATVSEARLAQIAREVASAVRTRASPSSRTRSWSSRSVGRRAIGVLGCV